MNIRKGKKLVIKMLLSVLFGVTVFASFTTVNVTYAVHTCPTGWTLQEPNKCTFAGSIDCTTVGMVPSSETSDTGTICTKITATSKDSAAQIDRANVLLSIQAFLNKAIWPILILIGQRYGETYCWHRSFTR